jgi:hypothetical protein
MSGLFNGSAPVWGSYLRVDLVQPDGPVAFGSTKFGKGAGRDHVQGGESRGLRQPTLRSQGASPGPFGAVRGRCGRVWRLGVSVGSLQGPGSLPVGGLGRQT